MKHIKVNCLKSIVAVPTVLMLFTTFTYAQQRRTSILKLGTGISFFSGYQGTLSVPRVGLSVGLAPTIPLSLRVYLKPEVAYSMKGGRIDYQTGDIFSGNVRYRVNYFDFPLVLGIRTNRWLAVELGGYAAIKTGGNFDFEGTFAYGYGTFDRDDLNSYDYGPIVGTVLHSRRIQLGIRYYYGMMSIAANDRSRVLLGSATNHTIQVCVQLKRLGRR